MHSESDREPADEGLAGEVDEVELAQGLGLTEALTIGVGTMIGAGIFVLPGFIIGKAGPAAVLSFALGGVIALFNAMSAAEVATGMPKSGGGYYCISRALGPLWGAIIGWGSWSGLIFASAFYAVGFGEYVATVVHVPVTVLAALMTALLVVLNLTGSRAAGQAQNWIVAALVGGLALFIGRGLIGVDPGLLRQDFMPFGAGAVVAGTATLFVAYCGFGEIASMAEEIREPGRNLPRALLGSVVTVSVLYCLVLLICLTLRPYQQLTGPTVVADLAGNLMGSFGRMVILLCAVMATVSSANASIMSASRISFAMGRDGLISDWLNHVHPHFRVPHRAILVTGALILGIIFIGRIEVLAEAAGLLHLLLYGLISLACIVLRGARLSAYKPAYRVPLFPLIPALGALGSLGVAFFMERLTILMGLAIIVFAVGHYVVWTRKRTELRGGWPHFLRRGILEPALECAERWGAAPEDLPTAMVAVGDPAREWARLTIADAMMGSTKGRILAVNVFTAGGDDADRDALLTGYYQTIQARNATMQRLVADLASSRRSVASHVPVATSVFYGLISAAQASSANTVLVGWPEPTAQGTAEPRLLAALDRYLRAHILVFREQGPVPAGSILAVADGGIHGELATSIASQLAAAWRARLTVASLVPVGAGEAEIARAEGELELRVDRMSRAGVRAIPADSVSHLGAEAAFYDMIVLGVPGRPGTDLPSLIAELDDVKAPSLLLVRAHPDQAFDLWM
jgi:amino acid transporter